MSTNRIGRPRTTDGISFAPTLLGKKQAPRPFLYREFPAYGGQQSVWVGDWKGIRQRLNPQGQNKNDESNPRIELYNLQHDAGETKDVSGSHREIVARIERIMRQEHRKSQLFPFPVLDNQ
jgi:arylsulfatase